MAIVHLRVDPENNLTYLDTDLLGLSQQAVMFVTSLPAVGQSRVLYVNTTNSLTYYWTGSAFQQIASATTSTGDMLKSVYDINNNGIVDNSNLVGGASRAFVLSRANHTDTQPIGSITGLQTALDGKEAALSLPATNGLLLTSSTTGVKSWIPQISSLAWGAITGTIANQADLVALLNAKANTSHLHTASEVGLGNVDNTSDANKPVSTATATALLGKANVSHLHVASDVGLGNVDNTSDANKPISTAMATALLGKANASHFHTSSDVGLGNVDNTSDADKPISTATATALLGKANVSHLHTASDVGLGNVNNTSDADKPISTATAAALAGKAPLVGGLVPAVNLPSFVDDVIEFTALSAFPAVGEFGKIYVASATKLTYRWSGSGYVALGGTSVAGGVTGNIQVNSSGQFAGDSNLTWDGTSLRVTGSNADMHIGSNGLGFIDKVRFSFKPPQHTGGNWQFHARDNPTIAFLDFSYGGAKALSITHQGNVGVGVLEPQTKLEIGLSKAFNPNVASPTLYNLHLRPIASAADNSAVGITFGAGNSASYGQTSQAAIYSQFGDQYGTKMYFATTDSFAAGSKVRMMIDHKGNVGVGVNDPTAAMHIKAGTATTAPLRINAGVLTTAIPPNGTIEFDGNALYITVNGVRRTLMFAFAD